jgi:RNA polymerase-associated protein CTR9
VRIFNFSSLSLSFFLGRAQADHPNSPSRTAKARLALLLLKKRDRSSLDAAHVLRKEALTSLPTSSELRALYTYFLVETGQSKLGREFARSTIKEISRHDLYALCASGALYYHDARENKSSSKEALKDRTQKFTRSAEFFEKALQLTPHCAFAAQGLAIALAEGALGNGPADTAVVPGTGGQAPQALTEQQARLRNARDTLGVLIKVKESINDASVYVNIGHCHFARDEYEKAIENVRIHPSSPVPLFLPLPALSYPFISLVNAKDDDE